MLYPAFACFSIYYIKIGSDLRVSMHDYLMQPEVANKPGMVSPMYRPPIDAITAACIGSFLLPCSFISPGIVLPAGQSL